jgi:hypothetical protein
MTLFKSLLYLSSAVCVAGAGSQTAQAGSFSLGFSYGSRCGPDVRAYVGYGRCVPAYRSPLVVYRCVAPRYYYTRGYRVHTSYYRACPPRPCPAPTVRRYYERGSSRAYRACPPRVSHRSRSAPRYRSSYCAPRYRSSGRVLHYRPSRSPRYGRSYGPSRYGCSPRRFR